ncbi:DNA-3-methyladenine glycosylase I [Acholeplasma equirhinis]|nr:DNA-3-methyladenine glycosylase I [Acholeplasma equirhinis]MBN3490925.1 DNA-3-methyladenine glycosylase I [Acholeplasma equirhinis]
MIILIPFVVSQYDEDKITELMNNEGIVRNKLKINAMISNSRAYLKYFSEPGSFTKFIWERVNFKPIDSNLKPGDTWPVTSKVSDDISNELKKMGFKFVGSTIIYAFLQAVGVYNDHMTYCHCYEEIKRNYINH